LQQILERIWFSSFVDGRNIGLKTLNEEQWMGVSPI
jgi:hypothetical protein